MRCLTNFTHLMCLVIHINSANHAWIWPGPYTSTHSLSLFPTLWQCACLYVNVHSTMLTCVASCQCICHYAMSIPYWVTHVTRQVGVTHTHHVMPLQSSPHLMVIIHLHTYLCIQYFFLIILLLHKLSSKW